jgi:hypothetical protein
MMQTIWIYKLDGTIQCEAIQETTIDEDRALLKGLIGNAHVLQAEKRYLPSITVCGAPTGACNAFETTQEGWWLLNYGVAGNPGFRQWNDEFAIVKEPDTAAFEATSAAGKRGISVDPEMPLPKVIDEILGRRPVVPFPPKFPPQRSEDALIGKILRVYETGDAISKDWNPQRVNIELAPGTMRIVSAWAG